MARRGGAVFGEAEQAEQGGAVRGGARSCEAWQAGRSVAGPAKQGRHGGAETCVDWLGRRS